MATIGRRAAVAELFGLNLRGTLAWLSWLGLHITYLIGYRNRASVLLNWAWNYLTYDRGPRFIFDQSEPPPAELARPRMDRAEIAQSVARMTLFSSARPE